jgi:Flp pilus assembly protein TadG
MRRRHWKQSDRRGAAVVELAFVLPLLVVLISGIWEVGRAIDAYQLLFNACREAGRQAATGRASTLEVQQLVLTYLERSSIPTGGMDLPVIENLTDSNRADPADAEQLDHFRVTAVLPLENFSWSPLMLFGSIPLTASADWYSMKDLELTVSQQIPSL